MNTKLFIHFSDVLAEYTARARSFALSQDSKKTLSILTHLDITLQIPLTLIFIFEFTLQIIHDVFKEAKKEYQQMCFLF